MQSWRGKYKSILETLGEQGGTLGKIFRGATNKINNAAILYRIVQMIDKEKWVSMSTDVKGEIYGGPAAKERRGREKRRGPVFYSPPADPGHGGVYPPRAHEDRG